MRLERVRVGSALALVFALCACSRDGDAGSAPPARAAAPGGDERLAGAGDRRGAREGLFVYECLVDGRNQDICAVPVGGGSERRLTTHAADDMWPRWTPDGRAVVFSSERTGTWQLWEVDLETRAERRLRASPAREWQADPSPDGRRLAFISDAGGEESLRVARPGGGGDGRLVLSHGRRSGLGNPHWSPDGGRLAVSSNAGHTGHHVYVVGAEGGEDRRISPLLSGACEPRFRADGRKVAYVRRRHATRERSAIVEHDLDTGRERVLVDWPAYNYDPVWSRDGAELAFTSTIAARQADVHSIYRLRLSDGRSWRVTFEYPSRHPDYRPAAR